MFTSLEDKSKNWKWACEADQIEWQALELDSSSFTSSEIDEIVSGEFDENQREGELALFVTTGDSAVIDDEQLLTVFRERQAQRRRRTDKQETLAAGIRCEIERRAELLGEHYPFEVRENGIRSIYRSEKSSHRAYHFFLKTAVQPSSEDREQFEREVGNAIKRYLGERSQMLGFGWQSHADESEKRKRIREMIQELTACCGEWKWDPEDDFPDHPSSTLVKDMGIDVVAWLPLDDGRTGQVFLVAQCATGHTDWENKLRDVSWDRAELWIRPTPHRWSVRCFAIPFHLPNRAHWTESSKEGGMMLDRTRLTLLLQ